MTASDELLSQFKVANFSTMEDDPILPSSMNTTPRLGARSKDLLPQEPGKQLTTSGDQQPSVGAEKSWDDIIPFDERQRIELENEEEQLRQINLASISRRNRVTNQKDQYLEDELEEKVAKKSSKKAHKKSDKRNKESAVAASEPVIEYDDGSQLEVLFEENEEEGEEGEAEDSNDSAARSKKSKRYQTIKKSMEKNVHFVIRGLNTQEVRRFIRSFKKFPCPLLRIDTIAQDAQLEEKSQAFLIDFATKMKDLFTMACKAYDERYLESNGEGEQPPTSTHCPVLHPFEPCSLRSILGKVSKKRTRGPNIVLNGIKLNARQILDAEKYFQPLADYFSSTEDKKYGSFCPGLLLF